MNKTLKGSLIATAAAGLFMAGSTMNLTSSSVEAAGHETGYCKVKNSCKGKGVCGVKGKHSCAGKNTCKGQGFVKIKNISKADCMNILDAKWKPKKS